MVIKFIDLIHVLRLKGNGNKEGFSLDVKIDDIAAVRLGARKNIRLRFSEADTKKNRRDDFVESSVKRVKATGCATADAHVES